jgi:inhibitor of KinA
MTKDKVIELFSREKYPVYCLGFLCGLAYMGGVPKRLQLPRLTTPRTFLPAGSVGFANAQAVVLPIDQPSGFHYIGRTFVTMYDPHRTPPTPIAPGDLVQCPSVSEAEARSWAGRSVQECLLK